MESNERSLSSRVSEILMQSQCEKLLLVLDANAYRLSGAQQELEPLFRNIETARFTDFEPNPQFADLLRGIDLCIDFQPQMLLAVGGGTAIDFGKLIGTLSLQAEHVEQIITGARSIQVPGPPLVAIPTTAGTGSEATHFAVTYIDGVKYSCAHPTLLPAYPIVEPSLTYSLPKRITAETGLDALCQALESIWAVGATEQSLIFAEEAATLAHQHIRQVTNAPTPKSRAAMCRSSHLAGKAINISKTTGAHALSYFLTARYGIPHGLAVALMFSPLLEYNAAVTDDDCADPRGTEYVRNQIATVCKILGGANASQAADNFRIMLSDMGCPMTLTEAGVMAESEIRALVQSVNLERMSNNPRRANTESLITLLTNTARAT